jgi:hypothetical protein
MNGGSRVADLWYAGYGSNLARDRFEAYLSGGRPAGATRTYPGARDPGPPVDDRPLLLPGRIFFAWKSPTWGGGIAFYDPEGEGTVYARAYRISHDQFSDLAAQEMRRDPGHDLDLSQVLERRRHSYGPGRYETLHLVGELDDLPVLTFTAPADHSLPARPPTPAYLATIVRGLHECHGLSEEDARAYLAAAAS